MSEWQSAHTAGLPSPSRGSCCEGATRNGAVEDQHVRAPADDARPRHAPAKADLGCKACAGLAARFGKPVVLFQKPSHPSLAADSIASRLLKPQDLHKFRDDFVP